jgi:hypothetical protein
MINELDKFISANRAAVYPFLRHLLRLQKPLLLKSELLHAYDERSAEGAPGLPTNSILGDVLAKTEVAIVREPWLYLAVRSDITDWQYLRIHGEDLCADEISVATYLRAAERIVDSGEETIVELDFAPFNRGFPPTAGKALYRSGGRVPQSPPLESALFGKRQRAGPAFRFFARPQISRSPVDAQQRHRRCQCLRG